nr:MAG TPA: alpha-aminoadipate carrier protein [Caudoviricetes sp.]
MYYCDYRVIAETIRSRYYRVCPYCGAHLDPGETCDCKQKGGAA